MKKREIAKRMARRAGIKEAEAADRVDHVVREILSRLRKGEDADLPGLGRFLHAGDGSVCFEPARERKHD